MAVINGITCQELVADLEEGIREGGPYATKKYLCAWGDRYALANSFLGLVAHSGGVNGTIQFTPPQAYPESPNLFAREVSLRGVGQPTQGPRQLQFPQAIVTVNYGVPRFGYVADEMSIDPVKPLVYATQEIDIGLDSYTIPASAVQVASPTAPLAKDVSIYYARAEISITLHRFPWLPAQLIFSLAGNLNNATFLGCGAGKLRFNGGKTHRTASTDGTSTQDVTLSFSFRNIARWDEVFHPSGTNGWKALQDKNANGLYVLSDLSQLIPASYHF